ncbi:MAG: hypothetical protein RLZ88_1012, partial [Actinomycetota bacterium]
MRRSIRRAVIASLATAGLLLSGVAVAPSWAVPSYPTAEEVAAAKKKVADKMAMIKKLEGIIAGLEVEADALNKTAQIKGEAFNIAQDAVDAVQAKVTSLQVQADAAEAQAAAAERQLGQIAAQMYREGSSGTSLNLFLNSGKADDLLYQLGAQERLAGQSNDMYQKSIALQKQAKALQDELGAAKAELATKAATAKAAFAEAMGAATAAQAKVDENERLNKT